MNLNKKEKELLMYCVLAFATGYLMCMYYPVHRSNSNGSLLEGYTDKERVDRITALLDGNDTRNSEIQEILNHTSNGAKNDKNGAKNDKNGANNGKNGANNGKNGANNGANKGK